MSKKISKFLSFVLRHHPEEIGIILDENGWVDVNVLIDACNKKSTHLTLELLKEIVETNDKKRFSFNDDYTKIRANQGHSIDIDLNLLETDPPTILYHGTVSKFIDNINKDGLIKGDRHHVHLSADIDTAISVGSRRGTAIVLKVNSFMMYNDGFKFYLSENGVWLTDHVPAIYISK